MNAASDPELAKELTSENGPPTIEDPETGARCPLFARRLYHDPSAELFVLVLSDADRHRELECRAELYLELAKSPEVSIPDYVRNFLVVYNGRGILEVIKAREEERERTNLAGELTAELATQKEALKTREDALAGRANEFQNLEADLNRREGDLARSLTELARERSEFARARSEAEGAEAVVSSVRAKSVSASPGAAPNARETQKGMPRVLFAPKPSGSNVASSDAPVSEEAASTSPFSRVSLHENENENDQANDRHSDHETSLDVGDVEEISGDDVVVADQMVAEPISHEPSGDGSTQVGGSADVTLERWIASRDPSLATIDDAGHVRFAAALAERSLEGLLGKDLKVMLQLHALPTYPLVTLSVGTPEGFSKGRPTPATFHFNVGDSADRGVIEALARDFTFQIDLFDTDYLPVRKRTITAGLSPNAQYILAAADDALAKVQKRTEPSYTRALLAYDAPNYDRFGRMHPERKEFREDVLLELDKPSRVRWAVHVCRRFSSSEGQEYLFLTRGYPLRTWQVRRRAVVVRACALGLWIGNTLAGIAVSEGIAGSRRDLAETLARNYVDHFTAGAEHDLDEDAVRDNWTALAEELRSQGLDPDVFVSPRSEAISSELQDVASGTIGPLAGIALDLERKPMSAGQARILSGGTLSGKSTDELIAMLGDRDRRYEAALELCRSSTPAAVRPLFSALKRMTRAEAGHVFGGVVNFGEAALPHLIETLESRKGFLRQGAALALAAVGAPQGIEPVCELLVSEPTDIWKEVARALGEFGPASVMALCTHLRGSSEVANERIAWALAHVASQGDRIAIDTLAAGRDPVAAGVARHALELAELARSDNRSIWNPRPGREHTVKRAFSKRVFEALPNAGNKKGDSSAPSMALSEADLLDAAELEDGIELDESDLLPS